MARFNVEVQNLKSLQAKLDALPDAVRRGAERATSNETEELAAAMRGNAPVDTGELVDSIHAETSGSEGQVVVDADHAGPVEFGTSTTPAQPYIEPAVEQVRQSFPQRVRDEVRSELPT